MTKGRLGGRRTAPRIEPEGIQPILLGHLDCTQECSAVEGHSRVTAAPLLPVAYERAAHVSLGAYERAVAARELTNERVGVDRLEPRFNGADEHDDQTFRQRPAPGRAAGVNTLEDARLAPAANLAEHRLSLL
eukprot:2984268-Prymnesium_polylepis.1